jgi:NitT/TauT family transport system substrate-binding protein
MGIDMKRRDFFAPMLAALIAAAGMGQAQAQGAPQNVKFAVDWAYQGNHAFWSMAIDQGIFKKYGLNVTMDRGFGSGDTIVKVASGAYDIGFADISPMIKFNAEHPAQHLVAVYQVFDRTAAAVIALERSGIKTPADLAGKKLAAPDGDASRLMFPVFAKANNIDPKSVTWLSVAPNLREALLVKGGADAITGFTTTSIFNLIGVGIPRDKIVAMPFAKYGLDLYGSAVIVKPAFAAAHPDIVKAFVKATIEGEIATMKDEEAGMKSLLSRDPMFNVKLEKDRLDLLLHDNIMTPDVLKNGLGSVDPKRMQETIDVNTQVYDIKDPPKLADVYTVDYLPPKSERMPPH